MLVAFLCVTWEAPWDVLREEGEKVFSYCAQKHQICGRTNTDTIQCHHVPPKCFNKIELSIFFKDLQIHGSERVWSLPCWIQSWWLQVVCLSSAKAVKKQSSILFFSDASFHTVCVVSKQFVYHLTARDVHFSPIWASCILTLINPQNITGERSLLGTCAFPVACRVKWAQLGINPPIALAPSACEFLWAGPAPAAIGSQGTSPKFGTEPGCSFTPWCHVALGVNLKGCVYVHATQTHSKQLPPCSLTHTLPQTHWHTCAHCNGSSTRSGGSSLAGSVSCWDGCWGLLATVHTAWFISCYRPPWLFTALGRLARHHLMLPERDIKVRDKKIGGCEGNYTINAWLQNSFKDGPRPV